MGLTTKNEILVPRPKSPYFPGCTFTFFYGKYTQRNQYKELNSPDTTFGRRTPQIKSERV